MPKRILAPLAALGLSLLAPREARAVDRQDTQSACFPPVQAVIDPEWHSEAQKFKQQSLATYARYAGGEDAARQQMKAVLRLAEATRVPALDLIQLTRELFLRGFRDREMETVRAAALDLWATQGSDAAQKFIRILAQVKARGSAGAEDIRELDPIVARLLVKDGLDRQKLREEGLAAETFLSIVVEALLRQVNQIRPGEAAQKALKSCVAAMSRSCPRREAEEHCKSTPKEYLQLMWQGL